MRILEQSADRLTLRDDRTPGKTLLIVFFIFIVSVLAVLFITFVDYQTGGCGRSRLHCIPYRTATFGDRILPDSMAILFLLLSGGSIFYSIGTRFTLYTFDKETTSFTRERYWITGAISRKTTIFDQLLLRQTVASNGTFLSGYVMKNAAVVGSFNYRENTPLAPLQPQICAFLGEQRCLMQPPPLGKILLYVVGGLPLVGGVLAAIIRDNNSNKG